MCTKTCRTCNKSKPLAEFPWQQKHGFRGAKGCYRRDCKDCTAAKAREYRKTYSPSRRLRTDVDKLPYQACGCRRLDAKYRAHKAGLPFDLTTDYLYELLDQQGRKCAVSGIPLEFEKGKPHVLSLDQVNPGEGYTEGNVQWLSWAVNRAKGDLPMAEFVSMCQSIARCNDYPERE